MSVIKEDGGVRSRQYIAFLPQAEEITVKVIFSSYTILVGSISNINNKDTIIASNLNLHYNFAPALSAKSWKVISIESKLFTVMTLWANSLFR